MLSEDGFKNAVEHLERAVALDPELASAYAALAMAYWEPTTYGWADPAARVEPARQAIDKALALDPDNSEAHASAGYLAFGYYDWAKAERELRHALELNSDNAYAYKYLVWSLATANRYDEAIDVGRTAVELDPLNAYALDALADAYSMAGQFDRSIPLRLQIQELAPDRQGNLLDLGLDYLAAGQPEDSLRVRQRMNELRGQDAPTNLAVVYAHLGQRDEALALLANRKDDPSPANAVIEMATAYALLGDAERAIDWLEYAYEHRAMVMVLLNVEWWPFFEPLEGHPRYEALREKMAFPG
jgi:tetratricopeptide (TPR) repeat protein